jgi:hypothetical protein
VPQGPVQILSKETASQDDSTMQASCSLGLGPRLLTLERRRSGTEDSHKNTEAERLRARSSACAVASGVAVEFIACRAGPVCTWSLQRRKSRGPGNRVDIPPWRSRRR